MTVVDVCVVVGTGVVFGFATGVYGYNLGYRGGHKDAQHQHRLVEDAKRRAKETIEAAIQADDRVRRKVRQIQKEALTKK
jgi:hypothetical protein